MAHNTPLISTIVVGLVLAFVFGTLAQRLRISPLVGYLLAGVLMGPFTPGYVADQHLAHELAEIGVILLMFGVGLHFSLKDLLSVRAIAVPGAIVQIAVATLMGLGLAVWLGWPLGGGIVFGLALSVASTVVLLARAAGAAAGRHRARAHRGRLADRRGSRHGADAGAAAGAGGPAEGGGRRRASAASALPLLITLGKVGAFVAFMLIIGRRVIPWILHYVAHTGSRELFRLAVLCDLARHRLWRCDPVRRVVRARRVLRRHDPERVRAQPPRRAGDDAAARRLRRAVLRLGRHAGGSRDRAARSLAAAGDRVHHRHRQVGGRLPDRARVRPSVVHRLDDFGVARADRRILVHPRRASACRWHCFPSAAAI